MGRLVRTLTLSAVLLAPVTARPDTQEPQPFPVARTQILREEGSVYFVEGRVHIPKGVEVTCLKDVHIRAKGEEPAIIEVEGSLIVHGVGGREVIFEGVTVEPAATFEEIRMDMTVFRKGGGIRTPPDRPSSGDLMLELFDVTDGAAVDVTMNGGDVELSSVCSDLPVRIVIVDQADSDGNQMKVNVRGCVQDAMFKCQPHKGRVGLRGGLILDGADQMIVRLSRLAGETTAIRNWGKSLIFDGNKVNSQTLEITHREQGNMSSVQFVKCDLYSTSLVAKCPVVEGKSDTLKVVRCFFPTGDDANVIATNVITDADDDPANGVHVRLTKPKSRPYELAGPAER